MRKTVEIVELISEVNRINAESTCDPEGRKALNSFLANLLTKNNVYRGFGFLEAHQVPSGQKPGIIFDRENGNHEFPDESRRVYYTKPTLRATEARVKGIKKFRKIS